MVVIPWGHLAASSALVSDVPKKPGSDKASCEEKMLHMVQILLDRTWGVEIAVREL
jgi:hypothetical protein